MAYTLEHVPVDAGHLITVTGELDLAATPELSTVLLMAARSPGPLVVLDLGCVAVGFVVGHDFLPDVVWMVQAVAWSGVSVREQEGHRPR